MSGWGGDDIVEEKQMPQEITPAASFVLSLFVT